MFAFIRSSIRVLLVAVLTGFVAAAPAEATGRSTGRETTYANTARQVSPGDPDMGMVWIVVGIAVIVFFVWLFAKIGDAARPSDGVMG